MLKLAARFALALFGAFLLMILAQAIAHAARTIQAIPSRARPEPDSWALIRAYHAPALGRKEVLVGLATLIVLLLLPFETAIRAVVYGWVGGILVGLLDGALLRFWRWRSRLDEHGGG